MNIFDFIVIPLLIVVSVAMVLNVAGRDGWIVLILIVAFIVYWAKK